MTNLLSNTASGLDPSRLFIRGTAQNPDVYFQARETVNEFILLYPGLLGEEMEKFAGLTGRRYSPVTYFIFTGRWRA
ncbi:MAG: hypothetical protein IPN51_13570 [Chloracidobacterium sp.]|nr:hypothetical protein [Chloracidobacterium sp.]